MCKTVGNNAINNWYKGSHRQIGHFMPSPDAVLIYVGHNRIKNRASLCEFEVKCEMRIITLRIRILKIRRMRRPRCAYVLRRNFTFLRGEWLLPLAVVRLVHSAEKAPIVILINTLRITGIDES